MEIIKKTIKGSPYIGVFVRITNDYGLFPKDTSDLEIKKMADLLDITIIRATLSNCSLNGILSSGVDKKFVVTQLASDLEIKELEKEGLEILQLAGVSAVGNLVSLNNNGGIASPLLSNKHLETLEDFFGVSFVKQKIAENDVPGASITTTNKGFIVHPNITDKDYENLKNIFKTHGTTTTANYGDPFVGNSVIANNKAAMVGAQTSGHELIRIDEGLRGN